ncbi:MAG: type I DNA topoisomerase [Myxococcaceae bacterium]|nr:type I DNA topoisomerase [Myxococcaceae bacterium]
MGKPLVIVESPAKAKTIGQFLGDKFKVMASIGHVVDLPSGGLAVDVENDFKLTYEVTKKDVVRDLKDALKGSSELYLATDEDREGEAIAWHLMEQLKPKVPVKRMVFHEITKRAIAEAVDHWRELDPGLVDAQETRRTLDRLYGYEVSPVLWRKVKTGLSAGRVQSPSIRLIVERERERMRFRSVAYWDISAHHPTTPAFFSNLFTVEGKRVAAGKDFDENGQPKKDVLVLDEAGADKLVAGLEGLKFKVASLDEKPSRSSPKPPFMTSTLQQEAGRKLNMSAQQVMRVAQGLYERGYITYMRTDSTSLSETALNAARTQVKELFGEKFLPAEPRLYAKKVKNAQEAHEAIRPAGEAFQTPEQLSKELQAAELKLYDLIWKRTVASQMADATGMSQSLKLAVTAKTGEKVEFSASGRTIVFPGYLRAYVEGSDDPEAELDDRETVLPTLKVGDEVEVTALEPKGHTTTPPARYTEASLVKKLEELGIGRPSTYASIMGTLQAKYVWKKGSALIPNWEAFAVVNLMEKHFQELVDYAFTARMEDDLDEIAGGQAKKVPYLKEFYWGSKKDGRDGLHKQVTSHMDRIDAAAVNSIYIGKDTEGADIVVKPGRYGPYVKRGEDTAAVPDALPPDEMTPERALALLNAPKGDKPIGVDPATGLNVYAKLGRFGPYVQLGEMSDDSKPKTASLFRTMSLETMTLDTALQLLTLPRTLGVVDGEEVKAHNGKFGPYVTHGKESRNMGIENEPKLLTLTLEEAIEILKQPKQFRGRGAPKPPLKVLGPDPVSGKEMVLKEGRFGLYVTDGETNASLRKGDTVESLTPERAAELMEARREYIASGASPRGKKPKKGATKKKAAAADKDKQAKQAKQAKASAPKSKGKATPAAKKGKGKVAAKKKGRS